MVGISPRVGKIQHRQEGTGRGSFTSTAGESRFSTNALRELRVDNS